MTTRTETPNAPADFVYTSQDVFFATVGQLNVHPTPKDPFPYVSEWRMLRPNQGKLMGWSYEGRYAIHPELVRDHMNANPKPNR